MREAIQAVSSQSLDHVSFTIARWQPSMLFRCHTCGDSRGRRSGLDPEDDIEALVGGSRASDVTAVGTGTKAIDVAATNPPDMVLLDLMVPGHDGFEVCRRLRTDPSTRHVPILIIQRARRSGLAREGNGGRCDCAYYTKPFSPMALLKEDRSLERRARRLIG